MQIGEKLHVFLWESMTVNNCNTILINGDKKILIDPGHVNQFDHVQKALVPLGLSPDDIHLVICTHAHPDHMEALKLFTNSETRFTIHEKDWQLVKSLRNFIYSSLKVNIDDLLPDFFLAEGDLIVGDTSLKVFHTPGHSPGSISLYEPDQKVLICGDLIFKEGVGRTDLPGGNGEQLKASIQRMADLDLTYLLPGHGEILKGTDAILQNFEQIKEFYFQYV